MAQNGGQGRRSQTRGGHGDGQEADINERREIRRGYRELLAKTHRERSELIRPETDGLNDLLEDAAGLYEKVQNLQNVAPLTEAVLDAQLLKTASHLGYQKAKKLHVDNKFDPSTFMEKLITFMHGRSLQNANEIEIDEAGWSGFGQEAESSFRRVPGFHFMYGTFEREPPKKKKAKEAKSAEEAAGPTVVPEKVKSMGKSHLEVTTEEVEKMVGILHDYTKNRDGSFEPISYFEFVINPDSFSQTVENIFHLSFVLKDGHARIFEDEDGLPMLVPAKPHSEDQSGKVVPRKQVLVSIDMEQWKKLIDTFDITEPIIPTRGSISNGQH